MSLQNREVMKVSDNTWLQRDQNSNRKTDHSVQKDCAHVDCDMIEYKEK